MTDKTYYALKYKRRFDFICLSTTKEEFNQKLDSIYISWKKLQARSNPAPMEDFLSSFEKVVVTVKDAGL